MTIHIYDFDRTLVWLPIDWNEVNRQCLERFNVRRPYDIPFNIRKDASKMNFLKRMELQGVSSMKVNEQLLSQVQANYEKGTRHAIFSNNLHKTIDGALRRLEVAKCFETIFGLEDVEKTKPNPEGLLKILRQFNAKPNECTYYGDLPKDEQAAKQAGVEFVKVEWNPL